MATDADAVKKTRKLPARAGGWLALILLSWLAGPGCGPRQHTVAENLLALVGDQRVTTEDFQYAWSRRTGRQDTPANRAAVLDEVVARKALAVEARRRAVDQTPEFRREYDALLIAHLRAAELEPRLRSAAVEPEEVQKHYRENAAAYSRTGAIHVAALFCEAGAQEASRRSAGRKSLEAAREKALALPPGTPGFGALAIEHTHHQPSRYAGGDLGWLSLDGSYSDFRATVMKIARELKEDGALSQVAEDERGWYLVKLIERREPATEEFGKVKDTIGRKLLREKRQKLEEDFTRAARERSPVQVWKARLETLTLPAAQASSQARLDPP